MFLYHVCSVYYINLLLYMLYKYATYNVAILRIFIQIVTSLTRLMRKTDLVGVLVSILDRGKRLEGMSHDRRVWLVINVILISSRVATI